MTHEIIPAHLAIKAMRDSGYKNAAYAIAELIDNSIQAQAKRVQLLCAEEARVVRLRSRMQIQQIAVIDDGSGMTADILRKALQFGNGTHLQDRSGIGRFGMGLPNSSLSQAAKVEVWTWQSGRTPIYSYLDLREVNAGTLREVPDPSPRELPQMWRDAAGDCGRSGTAVVWSELDRCQWGTARAIIENSELIIGRAYRRFIADGRVAIRMASFDMASPHETTEKFAQPNDPMYLMSPSSCPAPWNEVAMFERWGEPRNLKIRHHGRDHVVKVSFSIAKKKAREGHNPGQRDHGQHAANNVGVSIMRADRELELQLAWTTRHDPRERWWGAEVEFSPELDEVFGVTNDKQCARVLNEFAMIDEIDIAKREGFETVEELKKVWTEDNDPRLLLLMVKNAIETNLQNIRGQLQAQTARSGARTRHPDTAESIATEATRQRQAEGHRGESDAAEEAPVEVRQAELEQGFKELGLDDKDANERAVQLIADKRKFEFVHASLDTVAFFSVRPKGGALLININTDHPAYQHLVALLERDPDEGDIDALKHRMRQSYQGLKLLLEAWARYEDELPAAQKDRAREARADWGRVARQFLSQE